jgi:hypothetical protein
VYGFYAYSLQIKMRLKRTFLWVLLFTFTLGSAGWKRASGAGA